MAIENTVFSDFFYLLSLIVKSVFGCRLPSVKTYDLTDG